MSKRAIAAVMGGVLTLLSGCALATIASPVRSAAAATSDPCRSVGYGPQPGYTFSVTPPATQTQGTITVTISCATGDHPAGVSFKVSISQDSGAVALGTVTTRSDGQATGHFALPSTVTAGGHVVTAIDPFGSSVSAPLVVYALPVLAGANGQPSAGQATPKGATSSLAFTGADIAGAMAVGALAVGGGGAVVLLSRRRRQV